MAPKQRSILIVEDRADFRQLLETYCKRASSKYTSILHDIYQNLQVRGIYALDQPIGTVQLLVAKTKQEALDILADHPDLDCVSVDFALHEDEEGLDDDINVGGMRVLEELRTTKKRALSVVVSGEAAQEYPVKAALKYKVIGYFQKARINWKDYRRIITAALLYQEAVDYITNIESHTIDPDNLEIAKQCWIQAQQVIAQGEEGQAIDVNFPEDLNLRIGLINANLDRLTRRPTGEWIVKALKSRVIGREDWVVLRVQLDNFDKFRASYTDQVDSLHLLIATAIKTVVKEAGLTDTFIGLLSQEYLPEPCFIVIFRVREQLSIQEIQTDIKNEYRKHNFALLPADFRNEQLRPHKETFKAYSQQDRKKQEQALFQPFLPQLDFTVWDCQVDEDFYAFPDTRASIHTLTHSKPQKMGSNDDENSRRSPSTESETTTDPDR